MKSYPVQKGSQQEHVLIIGFGNILNEDHALVQIVADYLSKLYRKEPRVEIRAVNQLTLELAEDIAKCDLVILIDVNHQSGTQGQLTFEAVYPSSKIPSPLAYHLQPDQLLATAQALYNKLPQMMLIGLTTDNYNPTEDLSNQIATNLSQVFRLVKDLVNSVL